MSSVGLTFVGAALFLNALVMLGRVDAKSAGVFNLFIGALQTAIPFYLIATASTADEVLSASGVFLFGFTYLLVGVGNLAGYSGSGLGWYSAWVAVLAALFGVTNIVRFHDTATGLLWLQWVVLWAMFFVVLGLGQEQYTKLTAYLTLILSITTATVPGFLLLLGVWSRVPAWGVGLSMLVTAVVLTPAALAARHHTATATADEMDRSGALTAA